MAAPMRVSRYRIRLSGRRFKRFKLLEEKRLRDRGTQYTGRGPKWGSPGEGLATRLHYRLEGVVLARMPVGEGLSTRVSKRRHLPP